MKETQIEKIAKARQWLAEAKDLEELRQIRDIAVAAEAYAQAHRLGIDAENDAAEIKFEAAARIGELVPAETDKRHWKSNPRTSGNITTQRLSEFRQLAAIPKQERARRMARLKAAREKITLPKLTDGFYRSAEETVWSTPQWLFDLLDGEFHFRVDVCATKGNAKCRKFYSPQDDGLAQTWRGTCWMNPPYGQEIAAWMEKARQSAASGATVVCLVPGAYETEWFRLAAEVGEVRLINNGRVKWSGMTAATFPSAVIVLRPEQEPSLKWWPVNER